MEQLLQEEQLRKVEKLQVIAASKSISTAQLALAWILRLSNISSCIIGASRPDQIADNVKASGIKFSETELKDIEGILGTNA